MESPEGSPNSRRLLAELANDQLSEERKLKESLTQRSTGVITTSGVLVTLSLGVTSLTAHNKDNIEYPVIVLAACALAGFVVAASLALTVSVPRRQHIIDEPWLREAWLGSDREIQDKLFDARLALLTSSRNVNKKTSRLLLGAFISELIALGLMSIAVALLLLQARP